MAPSWHTRRVAGLLEPLRFNLRGQPPSRRRNRLLPPPTLTCRVPSCGKRDGADVRGQGGGTSRCGGGWLGSKRVGFWSDAAVSPRPPPSAPPLPSRSRLLSVQVSDLQHLEFLTDEFDPDRNTPRSTDTECSPHPSHGLPFVPRLVSRWPVHPRNTLVNTCICVTRWLSGIAAARTLATQAATGKVVSVIGAVVDVQFDGGKFYAHTHPSTYHCLRALRLCLRIWVFLSKEGAGGAFF